MIWIKIPLHNTMIWNNTKNSIGEFQAWLVLMVLSNKPINITRNIKVETLMMVITIPFQFMMIWFSIKSLIGAKTI